MKLTELLQQAKGHRTGIKGKNLCKVCGYAFGLKGTNKSADRFQHRCKFIKLPNGHLTREI